MRIRTPAGIVLVCAFPALLVVAAIGGLTDPTLPRTEGLAPGWIIVAACCLPLLRAPFVGVSLDGDKVQVTNWLRTRRVQATDVLSVQVVNYDGLLTRGTPSRLLHTVRLTTPSGDVTAWALLGLHRSVHPRAQRLRAALGLPEPQHGRRNKRCR